MSSLMEVSLCGALGQPESNSVFQVEALSHTNVMQVRAFNQQKQSISEGLETRISHVCDELCLCDGAPIKSLDTRFG